MTNSNLDSSLRVAFSNYTSEFSKFARYKIQVYQVYLIPDIILMYLQFFFLNHLFIVFLLYKTLCAECSRIKINFKNKYVYT